MVVVVVHLPDTCVGFLLQSWFWPLVTLGMLFLSVPRFSWLGCRDRGMLGGVAVVVLWRSLGAGLICKAEKSLAATVPSWLQWLRHPLWS